MSSWKANGSNGTGTADLNPAELGVRRSSLVAFVDYDYLYRQNGNVVNSSGRLQSFSDRKGNAYTPPITATVAAQFTEWTNGFYGLSLASNRGTFVSSSVLIPSSGDWTLMALFTQNTGSDGYPFADNDTSNWVGAGFLSTNALRVGWGSVVTFDPASSTNVGNPTSLILSWDAANGRLRTFLNNAEKDDRATTAPTMTDRKLMVGGRASSGSVTAAVEGTINSVLLFSEAGDDGSSFITALKAFGTYRANQGW